MKILYMGTPDFAARILFSLIEAGENIVGVVTQADKPQGRGYVLTPPPVKKLALEHGLPVFQPYTLKDGAFEKTLHELSPDLIIVAAYGKILPPYIINFPPLGCVNAHASLLPKYRGAAPIQRAIMEGETETGVTAMYMDEGLDTGDMILQHKVSISPDDNFGTVHDKLAESGAAAILDALVLIKKGCAPRTPQDHGLATYAAKITDDDMKLDFSLPAVKLHNIIRALSPVPGAYAYVAKDKPKLIKIYASSVNSDDGSTNKPDVAPGTVIKAARGVISVACGDGTLNIIEAQLEGSRRMTAADLINGRRIQEGDILKLI
ncbi:MAG TPA: methionyl-tRNA formyltransferase [Bacillota bacterium]|nr:methionyl-tRNA formyltransferase [Clostridiales bacterium]HOQ14728.1 methionyl-tRNA formyltransferase [Bacillota bacterium]